MSKTDTTQTSELPATLSERDQNRQQMKLIRSMTVRENVLDLPVYRVTKAKNSEKWAVIVEHPIEGQLRFFRDAPVHGWKAEDGNIVELMEWYHVSDPYELMNIHMKWDPGGADEAHDWMPVDPSPSLWDKLNMKYLKLATIALGTALIATIVLPNEFMPLTTLIGLWVGVLMVLITE